MITSSCLAALLCAPLTAVHAQVIRVGSLAVEPDAPAGVRLPALALRPGARYTTELLQRTERQITRALADAGHPLAIVEYAAEVTGDPPLAHVSVTIIPGPHAEFGEPFIGVPPSPLTQEEVARFLPFAPGDSFSASTVEHAVERLERLPIVERVVLGMTTSQVADSIIIPTFAIVTHPPTGIGAAGTISTARCITATVNWGHRHLFGAPRLLVISGGGGNLLARQLRSFPCTGTGDGEFSRADYWLNAELSQPLRADTWLTVRTSVSRVSEPQAYISRGYTVRGALVRELDRRLFLTGAISPERRDNPAAGPILCGVYARCAGDPLADLLARRAHIPLELALARDAEFVEGVTSPAATAPIWLLPLPARQRFGYRVTATGAVDGVLSDATYGTLLGTITAGRVLHPRLELAARLRAGVLLEGDTPPPLHARLYGGGVFGVRGVLPNRLGPVVLEVPADGVPALGCEPVPGGCEGITVHENVVRVRPTGGNQVAELNLEARTWAFRWLQLAGFVDVGALRTRAEPGAPVSVRRAESIVTPGIGIMAVTPFGPFRLDIAYDPSPARRYPLLTVDPDTGEHIVLGVVRFDPYTHDDPGGWREFRRRLTIQLSPGIPF